MTLTPAYQPVLDRISTVLKPELPVVDAQFSMCFSEAWFSNTLAWYLDPRASHGLGTRPAELFLKIVAKARSQSNYRRASHLKFGNEGVGRGATGMRLANAAVVREFFLSGSVERCVRRGSRYCDIVLFDLDHDDGLFVVIENKLFTCNRPGQLAEYHQAVEEKFSRAHTREYVYLTLRGDTPATYGEQDAEAHRPWLRLGWITHLYPGFFGEIAKTAPTVPGLPSLLRLLDWLKTVSEQPLDSAVEEVRRLLVASAGACLRAELERLRGEKAGEWRIDRDEGSSFSLVHSKHPSKKLYLELLPDCSITIQTRASGRALMEKILVPFGAHPDQVINLLQLAARDVYASRHFERPELYKDDVRRRRASLTDDEAAALPLFRFIHSYRHALQVCFLLNQTVRRQLVREYEREGEIPDEPSGGVGT